MFPELISIDEQQLNETNPQFNGTSFLFDFERGDFIYRNGAPVIVTGQEALKMWIQKVIRTEKFRFHIYESREYGVTLDNLIGTHYPKEFVESELEREITEVLVRNPMIEAVTDWDFSYENEQAQVSFRVITANDAFQEVVKL